MINIVKNIYIRFRNHLLKKILILKNSFVNKPKINITGKNKKNKNKYNKLKIKLKYSLIVASKYNCKLKVDSIRW